VPNGSTAAAANGAATELDEAPASHAGVEDGTATSSLIQHVPATGEKAAGAAVAAVAAAASAPTGSGCISWENLCYTVETPNGPKKLLDNVLGFAKPGMLVALMVRQHAAQVLVLMHRALHPMRFCLTYVRSLCGALCRVLRALARQRCWMCWPARRRAARSAVICWSTGCLETRRSSASQDTANSTDTRRRHQIAIRAARTASTHVAFSSCTALASVLLSCRFDSHNEKSTVREAVRFAAMLRLPASVTSSASEVDQRVTRTLERLGLIRMQHSMIGNVETGGISQEARKKVTIAVELIGEPRILFLYAHMHTGRMLPSEDHSTLGRSVLIEWCSSCSLPMCGCSVTSPQRVWTVLPLCP